MHFATHGLVAGDFSGLAEPALLLTPPDHASADDDGLLTASEVARLKLNADWVIMSACNTAAGGEANADALSGLARAFFYAGARSLLVSHWSVNSDATVKLITRAIAEIKANPGIGRSEALRRAMLAMIDRGSAEETHPSYWAPFVVVGEGTPDTAAVAVAKPAAAPSAPEVPALEAKAAVAPVPSASQPRAAPRPAQAKPRPKPHLQTAKPPKTLFQQIFGP